MDQGPNLTEEQVKVFFSEFVDWDRRRKGENRFFAETLRNHSCHKIFDSCVGDGYDAVNLLKEGFEVHGNDIDPFFIDLSSKNARAHGFDLHVSGYDWRNLPDNLTGKYDAVLCLGNSLTYLFSAEDRRLTVRNLVELVRPGGLVILDHRNYDYMLENREHILKDPANNFRYSGKFYYCNPKLKGFPTEIEDSRIVLNYSRDGTLLKGVNFALYPIKKEELSSMMKNAGLDTEVYGDFQKGKVEGVDFFQHIGVKK